MDGAYGSVDHVGYNNWLTLISDCAAPSMNGGEIYVNLGDAWSADGLFGFIYYLAK